MRILLIVIVSVGLYGFLWDSFDKGFGKEVRHDIVIINRWAE